MAYKISDDCIACGTCAGVCPVSAISEGDGKYVIDADACLDCGSCGSPTCHALAEDIVRGYRTEDDCIYLLKEKLEQLAQSLAGLSAHRTPMEDIEHDSE